MKLIHAAVVSAFTFALYVVVISTPLQQIQQALGTLAR